MLVQSMGQKGGGYWPGQEQQQQGRHRRQGLSLLLLPLALLLTLIGEAGGMVRACASVWVCGCGCGRGRVYTRALGCVTVHTHVLGCVSLCVCVCLHSPQSAALHISIPPLKNRCSTSTMRMRRAPSSSLRRSASERVSHCAIVVVWCDDGMMV